MARDVTRPPTTRIPISPGLRRLLVVGFAVVAVAALLMWVAGCGSNVETVHAQATHASELAHDTKDKLAQVRELLLPYAQTIGQVVFALLDGADANQDGIIGAASKVHTAAAGTTDKVWAGWAVLKLWGWVALIGMVVAAAIYFAVGPVIRRMFAWLGWLIPKADQEAAALDLAAVRAHPDSAPVREAVAAKRARKPTYDAAFRKAKRKERERLIDRGTST